MRRILPILILFIVISCITPVNIDPEEPDNTLAIDGLITNGEGPFEVVIQRVARFAGVRDGGTFQFIRDAEVFITDQDGNRTDLEIENSIRTELVNGCRPGCCPAIAFLEAQSRGYRTPPGFSALIGNTYTLNILYEGRRYQSTPQTVRAGPEIDSISYRFRRLPSADPVTFQSGVDIFSTWEDPPEIGNLYSWRINGLYPIETPPIEGTCCIYLPEGNGFFCYINERNMDGNLRAFSDAGNAGRITQKVGFIEDDGLRFSATLTSPEKQYYVEVEQMTISPEAFAFNRLLESQLDISGDIFDPPPAVLEGNIFNVEDPDELVIGFFGAYSVQTKGIFINKNDLEVLQPNLRPCSDCRVRIGAQSEIPEVFR